MATMTGTATGEEEPKGLLANTKLIGGILAALGLLGAVYLIVTQVLPAYQENQKLTQELPQKRQQLEAQKVEIAKKIAQANQIKAKAQQQKQEVEALFADEQTLNTLLLDLNRIVNARQADLTQFQPGESRAIVDGSLGTGVDGKLRGKDYQIRFKGSFDQTRLILLNMERLQPLLVVRELNTQVDPSTQEVAYSNGRLVTRGAPQLDTTMTVRALVPIPPPPPPEPPKQ